MLAAHLLRYRFQWQGEVREGTRTECYEDLFYALDSILNELSTHLRDAPLIYKAPILTSFKYQPLYQMTADEPPQISFRNWSGRFGDSLSVYLGGFAEYAYKLASSCIASELHQKEEWGMVNLIETCSRSKCCSYRLRVTKLVR